MPLDQRFLLLDNHRGALYPRHESVGIFFACGGESTSGFRLVFAGADIVFVELAALDIDGVISEEVVVSFPHR